MVEDRIHLPPHEAASPLHLLTGLLVYDTWTIGPFALEQHGAALILWQNQEM